MQPKLQRRVQRYGWDLAVEHYESFWQSQLEPAQSRMLEMADLETGQKVLDIACGTGLVTLPAARAVGPTGRVTATDISAKMLSGAQKIASNEGIENISFERMGAEVLDLEDASFDSGLCGLGLMYFPEPVTALRELYRVLIPGGRVSVCVWGLRNRCGWAEIFPIVDSRVKSEVCPMFFQLGGDGVLAKCFEAAGLVDTEVERLSSPLVYANEDEAVGAAFSGGPVALAYSRFDDETRSSARAEYLASIEPYRRGGGFEIPGEFVIATAIKPAA